MTSYRKMGPDGAICVSVKNEEGLDEVILTLFNLCLLLTSLHCFNLPCVVLGMMGSIPVMILNFVYPV